MEWIDPSSVHNGRLVFARFKRNIQIHSLKLSSLVHSLIFVRIGFGMDRPDDLHNGRLIFEGFKRNIPIHSLGSSSLVSFSFLSFLSLFVKDKPEGSCAVELALSYQEVVPPEQRKALTKPQKCVVCHIPHTIRGLWIT